jgi:hypothetical protein
MNLRPLHKFSPLNPPLHLLLLAKMIMHTILFPGPRLTRGMADAETKVFGGKVLGFGAGEVGDDCAFAYAGGSADY